MNIAQKPDEKIRPFSVRLRVAARKCESAEVQFTFYCQLPDSGNWSKNERVTKETRQLREVTLRAVIGPLDLDDPSPAITIMFPDED